MKRILLLLLIYSPGSFCQTKTAGWQLGPFIKPVAANPVMQADSTYLFNDPVKKEIVQWQKADVFNPAAIVRNNKVYILFRAEDIPGTGIGMRTSRIGLAVSDDGLRFKKESQPVLYPDSSVFSKYDYPGGCEDPRIVETSKGNYVLTYTSWNRDVARLSVATSQDLFHWKKEGPAFLKAFNGKFLNIWSKSGSIVTRQVNGKFIAAKINGKYWMYWGEHIINLAWSENLYDWNPLLDDKAELLAVVRTRPKMFDSDLTECGPPAIITDKGITLLYNGKNATNENADPDLPKGMYSVGMVVFDVNDPKKVIERSDTCFLKPTLPHEVTGQYQAGTTFSEALVFFKDKWFLYYGTADSKIAVAVKE